MSSRSARCGRLVYHRLVALVAATLTAALALAGGSPENALLIIDPANADSLYIGNYYKHARQVPDGNVIYMAPGATNYATFADNNLDALFGFLATSGFADHIDYIVVLPGAPFYVSAPGLVADPCSAITRFSISSVYTMAFLSDEILTGTLSQNNSNRYFGTTARGFDSSVAWLSGAPSSDPLARRYFIGTLLGYTGERGNTRDELIALIDRSVAIDGARPAGTFYFMNNASDPARNVRAPFFNGAVNAIVALGGQALVLTGVLPAGHQDCLGIMTGAAGPDIDGTDMTILPGAFCDHLTSYAATFDVASQVKLSRWIVKGASGSWGATEEPCNYWQKFPYPYIHKVYFEGLSLGEAGLRSGLFVPFQMLLYGDPLTQPFAYIPRVTVDDAPTAPVSGTIVLTPSARTLKPGAAMASLDLLIDGLLHGTILPGEVLTIDTTQLADGWHDLRVLGYDDTLVRSVGRWLGSMTVDNHGRAVTLGVNPPTGDWSTPFVLNVAAAGGSVREVRVVQNGRVVAAAGGSSATLTVYGLTLGAGPVRVQAEALFIDGRVVRSAPVELNVAFAAGAPASQPPVAFGYTRRVRSDQPLLLELPATFDNSTVPLTFEIVSGPTKATVASGLTGAYRLLRPSPGATGVDTFTFRAASTAGNSNVAMVRLVYDTWFGDVNCDGLVNPFDIDPFILALTDPTGYANAYPNCDANLADCNGDGVVNAFDIDPFIDLLVGG